MKRTFFLLLALATACGRSGLERDGVFAGDVDGTQATTDAGLTAPMAAQCELKPVCNASSPLNTGNLVNAGPILDDGLNGQQVEFDALDRPVIGFRERYRSCEVSGRCPYVVRRLEDGEWKALGCGFDGSPIEQIGDFRLETDRSGAIAVAEGYFKKTQVQLWQDGGWTALPELPGPSSPCMALAGGQPWMPWFDGQHQVVSHWDGASWRQVGGAIGDGLGTRFGAEAIALDQDGLPVVAGIEFTSQTEQHLAAFRFDGAGWQRLPPIVPPHSFVQGTNGMKIDAQGRVYLGWTDLDLSQPQFMYAHVARFENGRWVTLPDVGTNQSAFGKDLVLTSDGRPVISITIGTGPATPMGSGATVAEWNGSGWDRLLEDAQAGKVGSEVALGIDSHDRLAASWSYLDSKVFFEQVWLPDALTCR